MQQESCQADPCFLCQHCLPEWKSLNLIRKKNFQFKKGQKIFREGDPVDGMFFITEGSVKIAKRWGDQKELIIRFAKKGDVLGHRGFGGDLFYPITATALEDCRLCFVDNAYLETSLIANSSLAYQFMQLYAKELQKAEKRMRDLVHMEARGRIVQALFEIDEVFGTGDDDYLALPISRQDIASYAGTTYETVFKFFTDLSGKNILNTSGKNIKINDRSSLQSFISSLD
jgi:CRP/FNR family transcriptional regulator